MGEGRIGEKNTYAYNKKAKNKNKKQKTKQNKRPPFASHEKCLSILPLV